MDRLEDATTRMACSCCPPEEPADAGADKSEGDVATDLASLAKALGHPARVQIVQILAERDACLCGEIVDKLPLAQSTVSQHLKILREAGLVRGDVDGPRVCYCLNRRALERFKRLANLLGLSTVLVTN